MPSPNLIPPHGGYRNLKSYQNAEIIYDATVVFCNRFIPKRSRTHDQMVQAARSGKQNIAEGSVASGTSKKIELKLVSIARASLEERGPLPVEGWLWAQRLLAQPDPRGTFTPQIGPFGRLHPETGRSKVGT